MLSDTKILQKRELPEMFYNESKAKIYLALLQQPCVLWVFLWHCNCLSSLLMDRLPTLLCLRGLSHCFREFSKLLLKIDLPALFNLPACSFLFSLFKHNLHFLKDVLALLTSFCSSPEQHQLDWVLLNPSDGRGYTLLWAHIMKSSHQLPVLCRYLTLLAAP